MKANLFGKKIAFYIAIIIVWQAIDSADIWPDNIFPSPIEVGEDLVYGISAVSYTHLTLQTSDLV